MNKQEIRRAKKYMIFMLAIIVSAIFSGIFVYKHNHTFKTEKWVEDPSKRINMMDDLLRKHDLTGMTKEKIVALLGKESGANAYYQEVDNVTKYGIVTD